MSQHAWRAALFATILWTSQSLDATAVRAQDSLIVSFSRVESLGKPEAPQVELRWKVFKKNRSGDYKPAQPLGFTLTINETAIDTITAYRYLYTGNVVPGNKYICTIRIHNTDSVHDVTNSVNKTDGREYNQASFDLREAAARTGTKLPLLGGVIDYYGEFRKHGKLIALILTAAFMVSVISMLYHGVRLILVWWNTGWYIRRRTADFEDFLVSPESRQRLKGPLAVLLETGIQKLEQYNFAAVRRNIREKDSYKLHRLEQAIQDVTINEINRLTGRTSHKVISFFLSVDYFWNIGVIAPFLGLMGTVTGISKAFGAVSVFSALSKYEFKNIVNSLSGGINEALYTTIGGLVVGIVSLICYYFFVWRIDSVNKALNEAGDVLISKVSMRGS